MGLLFKKPERKLDSFLVPLRDKQNNKIRLRITDDIVLQKVLKVRDQEAYVVQCLLKDPQLKETIEQYDRAVLDHVLENCNSWFKADLSEEKILEMFLPSLSNQSELKALVSSIIEPVVMMDNVMRSSFCEVIPVLESKSSLSDIRIILELEAQGIYIRSRKFGIRWLVKSVRMFQEDHPAEELFDPSTCRDVIESYRDDIVELERQVGREVDDLAKKIDQLQQFMRRVKRNMEEIQLIRIDEGPEFLKECGERALALHKLIWNYQRHRLEEK